MNNRGAILMPLYAQKPALRVRCASAGMEVVDADRLLHVFGSSSAGNCYLLSVGGEHLVIEAGMDLRPLKEHLKWDFSCVSGCIISHQHGDHAGRVWDMLRTGTLVFALPAVFESSSSFTHPLARVVQPMHGYTIGGFKVIPIPVAHDVPCVAYVIEHEGMGRTLFLTDAMMLEYKLPGIVHWMVEANYTDEELDARVACGEIPVSVARRTRTTHMSLDTAVKMLCANDLSQTKDVMFIHLSADGGQEVEKLVTK